SIQYNGIKLNSHSFPTRRSSDLERRGNSMYGRRAFKEAATSFHFAAELFAKTPPDPRADIRALLNDYVRAVETKDLDLLRRRGRDRKSTRLNSSHVSISYAVFCL